MPIIDVATTLRSASARRAAMVSTSERGAGKASGSDRRITAGTAASVSASSDSNPSTSSIAVCSGWSGPT